jgi:DNA-binding NtrC family response regulator
VLVVDDDADWRELIADTLSEQGFAVATARDGRSACECVRRAKPEVVVTDVEMPFMNGYELFAHLRSLDRDLPVIVMSAGSAADGTRLRDAFRFIQKPVTTDVVTAAVQEAVLCRRRPPALRQLLDSARAAGDAARQRGYELLVATVNRRDRAGFGGAGPSMGRSGKRWARRVGSITVIAGVAAAAAILMATLRSPTA